MAKTLKNKGTKDAPAVLEDIEEAHLRFLGGNGGTGGVLEPLPAYPDLCTQPPAYPAVPSVTTNDIWGSAGVAVPSGDAELEPSPR